MSRAEDTRDDREQGADASDVSRRDALKSLAAIPLAGGLGLDGLLRKHSAVPAVSHAAADAPYTPRFLNRHEFQTLAVVADYIIPRDSRSGSATDAKAPEFIDSMLADPEASEATRTGLRGALAWLDRECGDRYGRSFIASTDAERRRVLDDVALPRKARPEMEHGVAAFSRVRDVVASAFFSSQMGWKDLQYEGNVFNPNWNGCPEPALKKLGVSYEAYNASLAARRKQ